MPLLSSQPIDRDFDVAPKRTALFYTRGIGMIFATRETGIDISIQSDAGLFVNGERPRLGIVELSFLIAQIFRKSPENALVRLLAYIRLS